MSKSFEHFDVIIVGAGLSGIGGAYYLQEKCPKKTFAILEARAHMGGTWDLFRYPGIRSDSSMLTMGYAFRPWTSENIISEGHLIREYIEDTAKDAKIDKHIRFGHKVVSASWSSTNKCWTLEVLQSGDTGEQSKTTHITCNFMILCAGYYKYDEGYTPDFPGREKFKGTVVHPNQWPENLNYDGKKIIVIGSGATAVTLIPNLAKKASHVTMLQRSPTYLISFPMKSAFAGTLFRFLPEKLAYTIARWCNIILIEIAVRLSQRYPAKAKKRLLNLARQELGDLFVEKDFSPSYAPWSQRLCLTPDGDFFEAIRQGRANIETDEIETFTENGVKLKSGKVLDADVIVTATGFNVQFQGGVKLIVDNNPVDISKLVSYKGFMLGNVPNLFFVFGYFFASWTLKLDVVFSYVCRILNRMDKEGEKQVTARGAEAPETPTPFASGQFTPSYLLRSRGQLPAELENPWRAENTHIPDLILLKFGSDRDKELEYKS